MKEIFNNNVFFKCNLIFRLVKINIKIYYHLMNKKLEQVNIGLIQKKKYL